MEEIFAMAHNHQRNAREELLYNSGGSIQKTLYSLSPEATEDEIHNLLLQNHSNLKTSSQHISAFQSIQQKPEEPLQTYNARYQLFYKLAHKGLTIESDGSKLAASIMPTLYMGNLVMKPEATQKPTRGIQEDHGL